VLTVISAHSYLAGVVAFLICAGLLPLVRYTAAYLGVHDLPGHLKIHVVPIPRVGGVEIGLAILISLMLSPFGSSPHVTEFCLALMVIWYVGLLDDLANSFSMFRLVAQLFAGVLSSQTRGA